MRHGWGRGRGWAWQGQGELELTLRAMLDGTSWNWPWNLEGWETEAKLVSPGLGPWEASQGEDRGLQGSLGAPALGSKDMKASQRKEEAWPTTPGKPCQRHGPCLGDTGAAPLTPLCALGCEPL